MESLVENYQKIMNKSKNPKISIGLPVYNAEKFIHKRIENLLSQTYTNFELIISDNASKDNTVNICKKFMEKDSRIKLHIQNHNIGQFDNFNFVLEQASGEYFVWMAADDLLLPTFLEKNVHILDTKKNIVTSVTKLRMFGEFTNSLKKNESDSFIKKIEKRIKIHFSYMDCFAISGEYEKKVCDFFKTCRHSQVFYGLHRTDAIKKCLISEFILGFDTFYALSLLRYGDIYVIDDVLMEVFDGGDSRNGIFGLWKMLNWKWYKIFFLWISFTIMCKNNIGTKLFLRNSGFFIKLNISGWFSLTIDILRKLRMQMN